MSASKEISKLQLYWGEPYPISDKISILQPTIGDILDYDRKFGESQFWTTLNVFIGNPTMYRVMLWDMGIDWNKITDFELFCILFKMLQQSQTEIFLGNIDPQKMDLYQKTPVNPNETEEEPSNKDNEEPKSNIVLYDKKNDIELNEENYTLMAQVFRTMFNIFPKVEKAKGKTAKEWIIEEDKEKLRLQKDSDDQSSNLLLLVSMCLNHPGFKYGKQELKKVGIYEFMDSVQRLRVYEDTRALLNGAYTGWVDTSKIDSKLFDFTREIEHN